MQTEPRHRAAVVPRLALRPLMCPRCGFTAFYTSARLSELPSPASAVWNVDEEDRIHATVSTGSGALTVRFTSVDLFCEVCHAHVTTDLSTQLDPDFRPVLVPHLH